MATSTWASSTLPSLKFEEFSSSSRSSPTWASMKKICQFIKIDGIEKLEGTKKKKTVMVLQSTSVFNNDNDIYQYF